jgi:hypothetical protein
LLLADSQPDGDQKMAVDRLENIVSLAKRRGFVYPSNANGGSPWSWVAKMLLVWIHV